MPVYQPRRRNKHPSSGPILPPSPVAVTPPLLAAQAQVLAPVSVSGLYVVAQSEVAITDTTCEVEFTGSTYCQGQVQWGPTPGLGSATTKETSFTWATHRQTITGLSAGLTYYWRCVIWDQFGTAVYGETRSFTTTGAAALSGYYGPGIAMNALANVEVGSSSATRNSVRFRAVKTGSISKVRFYWVGSPSNHGDSIYGLGTDGDIRFSIRRNASGNVPDETANGLLGYGTRLAANWPNTSTGADAAMDVTMTQAASVVSGELYHVVTTNVSSDPVNNWSCLDHCWSQMTEPRQYNGLPTLDWCYLEWTSSNPTWHEYHGSYPNSLYLPIMQIEYADGTRQGQSYLETWGYSSYQHRADGTSRVREVIQVSGGDRVITGLGVRCGRESGSSALVAELLSSGGAVLATWSFASSLWTSPSAPTFAHGPQVWNYAALANPVTLTSGQTYYLRFRTTAGTSYWFVALRKGNTVTGFDGQTYSGVTYFADGHAEDSPTGADGSFADVISEWGSSVPAGADFQFYFTTATPSRVGLACVWDAKGNIETDRYLGSGLAAVGIRFRATASGQVRYIRAQATNRWLPYGAGNGGLYTVGIRTENSGQPSVGWYGATGTWDPVVITDPYNWGFTVTITNGPTLVEGTLYWVVIQNIDANPDANYTSINFPWSDRPAGQHPILQPRWPDDSWGVYPTYTGTYVRDTAHFPAFDVELTNGLHIGMPGLAGPTASQYAYGTIDGTYRVRERFTVPVVVPGLRYVGWALSRWTGGATADVTATLKDLTGGTTLGVGIFTGSGFYGLASGPAIASYSGNFQKVSLTNAPHTLYPGRSYAVELSTVAGSRYWSRVVLVYDDSGTAAADVLYDDYSSGVSEQWNGSAWALIDPSGWLVHQSFYLSKD